MNRWMKGKFTPKNPDKYAGNVNKITFRSSWEHVFMRFCDSTPGVLKWSSEETIIPYFDPVTQAHRKYYMDFSMMVTTPNGPKHILVEIKPYKQTIKPRANKNKSEKTMITEAATWLTNDAKWKAAREYCQTIGWGFQIITENELFGGIDKGYPPNPKKRR